MLGAFSANSAENAPTKPQKTPLGVRVGLLGLQRPGACLRDSSSASCGGRPADHEVTAQRAARRTGVRGRCDSCASRAPSADLGSAGAGVCVWGGGLSDACLSGGGLAAGSAGQAWRGRVRLGRGVSRTRVSRARVSRMGAWRPGARVRPGGDHAMRGSRQAGITPCGGHARRGHARRRGSGQAAAARVRPGGGGAGSNRRSDGPGRSRRRGARRPARSALPPVRAGSGCRPTGR